MRAAQKSQIIDENPRKDERDAQELAPGKLLSKEESAEKKDKDVAHALQNGHIHVAV